MKAITTLNEIRKHEPCPRGWSTLLRGLGKTEADDEPLPLARVLEINGIADAIWAIRAVAGHEVAARLFACDCAESVLHLFEKRYPDDKRPRTAIEVARRFAHGEATVEELRNANAAAYHAAYHAANAAAAAYFAAAYAAYADAAAAYAARAAYADADAADAATRIELFKKHFCTA